MDTLMKQLKKALAENQEFKIQLGAQKQKNNKFELRFKKARKEET